MTPEDKIIEILDDYHEHGEFHEYTEREKKRYASQIRGLGLELIDSPQLKDGDELDRKLEAILNNVWGVAVNSANKRDDEYPLYKDSTIADKSQLLKMIISQEISKQEQN